jgi:hypothetical protein
VDAEWGLVFSRWMWEGMGESKQSPENLSEFGLIAIFTSCGGCTFEVIREPRHFRIFSLTLFASNPSMN